MRPGELDDMVRIQEEAQRRSEQYPKQFQELVRYLVSTGGMAKMCSRHPNWRYGSYEDLVLDLGTPRSAPLFVPDRFSPMEAKQCFYNAYMLATEDESLTYVEGYAQGAVIPTLHAWVEDEDGTIIDPTWANLDHDIDDPLYVGVRFDTLFLMERTMKTGYCGILPEDWRLDARALQFGFTTNEAGLVIAEGSQ